MKSSNSNYFKTKKDIYISAHNINGGGSAVVMTELIKSISQNFNINILISSHLQDSFSVQLKELCARVYICPSILNSFIFKIILYYLYLPLFWLFIAGKNPIFNIGNIPFPSYSKQFVLIHNAFPFYLEVLKKIKPLYKIAHYKNILMAYFIKINLLFADHVYVQTEIMSDYVKKHGISCSILPNFIYIPEKRNPLLPAKIRNILFVSNYHDHKNFIYLFEAFKKLYEISKDFKLYITLSDAEFNEPRFRKYFEPYTNLNIVNIGRVLHKDLLNIINSMDAIVNPSLIESFSTNYIEAFAMKKPLLVSDAQFSREICGDAAVYFNITKTDDFVEKLLSVCDDEHKLIKLVENGYLRYSYYHEIFNKFDFKNLINE